MTVNDILEKIEELNKIRDFLKTIYIYNGHYNLSSDDEDVIYDAYDAIGEYIDELKKKEIKE